MTDKVQNLEEEVKLLKNEIKQVLIDIKERLDTPGAFTTYPASQAALKQVVPGTVEWAPGSKDMAGVPKEILQQDVLSHNGNGNGNGNGYANGHGNGNGNGKLAQDLQAILGNTGTGNGNGNGNGHGNGNGNGKLAQDLQATIGNTGTGNGNGNGHGNGHSTMASNPSTQSYSLTGQPTTDLLTVATLSQWLVSGVKRIGRQRMELLIDVYSKLGGFPPALSDVLLKLLNAEDGDGQSVKQGIALLVEVDNLVNRVLVNPKEAAVLSLFLNGNGNGQEVLHR